MTVNVPLSDEIERVFFITVDCLRWDYHEEYKDLYPNGVWYRGTPQATYTPTSHTSAFTGLNPQRHGVNAFGDIYQGGDTLLTATDSLTCSGLSKDNAGGTVYGLGGENGQFWMTQWFPNKYENNLSEEEDYSAQGNEERLLSPFKSYELIWIHDWILHASNIGDNEHWSFTTDYDTPEDNHILLERQQKMTIAAHKNFLKALKENGLYENSLFIVWGDHGDALQEPPHHAFSHSHYPHEEVARTPMAFCSPLFDDKKTDLETNARGVDMTPTIQALMQNAGLEFEEMCHEYEGVDLTKFNGKLAGYTISSVTETTNSDDGVRIDDHYLLNAEDEFILYHTPLEPDGYPREEEVDNPIIKSKLKTYYEKFKSGWFDGIYQHEPDEQWLEDMGYL